MQHNIIIGVIVIFSIFLLISIILIAVSVKLVYINEFALGMNNNEQKIEKELVEGGRYWVGLGHSFIKFPRQIQTIVFWSDYKDQRKFDDDATVVETIQARTSEGLIVKVGIYVDYKITYGDSDSQKADDLYNIYQNFETDYESFLRYLVRATTRNLACNYKTSDFYLKRGEISENIYSNLYPLFKDLRFTLIGVGILNFQFPQALEDAIEETAIALQEVETRKNDLAKEEELKTTSIDLAGKDYEIQKNMTDAYVTSQNSIFIEQIKGEAILLDKIRETLEYYLSTNVLSETGKTNSNKANFVLTFMWIRAIEKHLAEIEFFQEKMPTILKTST